MSKTLEELGYEKITSNICVTCFFNKSSGANIEFDERYKTVSCYDSYDELLMLSMEKLKAIYKYCIDNKWI